MWWRARRLVRRHRVFAVLLAAGAAIRVVTMLAYQPALLGASDATTYLLHAAEEDLAPAEARPIAYTALLHALPLDGRLWLVPLLQHGLALAMAAAIYALVLRLGVRPWIAAIASAPVLLDGLQLLLGQYVMSETLFQALLVAGAVTLLWRPRLSPGAAALAGLIFAALALTRANGLALIVPALIAALLLRARPPQLIVMVACFVIPLAAYAAWFESVHGQYGITGYSGRFLYARVATFADCDRLAMPPGERMLCPKEPLGERRRTNWYMWARQAPLYRLGEARGDVAASFARRAIRGQPLDYVEVVLRSAIGGFAFPRGQTEGAPAFENWRFQDGYPSYVNWNGNRTAGTLRAYGHPAGGRADPELAPVMRGYQAVVQTPGPLLAVAVALGSLGALGVGPARRSGLRTAAFLFVALGVTVLLATVAVNALSWRYWVPELVLLPPAGALGVTALLGGRRRDRPPA